MWFSPGPHIFRRAVLAALLLFSAGTYLYVWCELLTPHWYGGRLRSRFGLLVPNGILHVLTAYD